MCGLNGIFAFNPSANPPSEAELIATRDHMAARGPDGKGAWWNEDRRVGFGHRRLSIIDLSARGNQPMVSDDGRYVVVFNGEIYNYPSLKTELEGQGCVFRSNSDTEVLIHLYAREGAAMVRRLRGMFAFAIWDNADRHLLLARDPYGIKPLYTANDGWTFRFASQVKALLAGGKVSREPEPAGVVGFHLWGNLPEPFTLYREIRALPAGHTQFVDAAGPREPQPYASIADVIAAGEDTPVPPSETAARIRDAVGESVRAHLLADVEVGLFLSAGVDSGALLGLMRDAGQDKIRAITLGFTEFRGTAEDEVPLSKKVARHYGAEHVVAWVSRRDFENDLPAIFDAMDQPSIDGINTWFVSKVAKQEGLKVALSGLGGDELFAGYPSFEHIPQWVRWTRVPSAVPGFGAALRVLGSELGLGKRYPKSLGMVEYGGDYANSYLLRRGLFLPFEMQKFLDPEVFRIGLRRLKPLSRLRAVALTPAPKTGLSRIAALESSLYLRNQLLRDCDWAGMAHSLEIRAPLVDFKLLEAISPLISRFSGSAGKVFLSGAPSTPLPSGITDRMKSGFGIPTGQWLEDASVAVPNSSKGDASRRWAHLVFAQQTRLAAPDCSLPPAA